MSEYSLKDAVNPNHPTSKQVGLRPLLVKIEANRQHLQIVRSIVSEDLAPHCTYASRMGVTMTIIVDSSSWATHLRLDSKRLVQQLRRLGDYADIKNIRVQVNKNT